MTAKKPKSKNTPQKLSRKSLSKKAVTKKVPKSSQTVTVRKKSLAKAQVKKKTIKNATVGQVSNKNVKKRKSDKQQDVVSLPENMSVRSVEKSTVLKSEFDHYFQKAMYQVAYVAGLCFILVGSAIAASFTIIPDQGNIMTAQVIDSTGTISTETTTAIPEFYFLDTIPGQIDEPFRVTFVVTNAEKVVSSMVKVGESGLYELEVEKLGDDKYRTTIPASNFSPAYYVLKVFVIAADISNNRIFESNEFHIGEEPVVRDIVSTDTTSIADSSTLSGTPEVNEGTNTTMTKAEETAVSIKSDEPVADPIQTAPITGQVDPFILDIKSNSVISGNTTFYAQVPKDYVWVELYARPLQSLDVMFISLASKRSTGWQFDVDTTRIPNGDYEFFAKTILNNKSIETKPVTLSVSNIIPVVTKPAPVSDYSNSPVNEGLPVRDLIKIEDKSFSPTVSLEEDVLRVSSGIINDNADSLEVLLQHYAIAQQSGDDMLVGIAAAALGEKIKMLVSETLLDESLRDISDDIDTQLVNYVEDLKQRIEIFEKLRREKSNGETSVDTDGDGISDYDETNLYKTNPEVPDTDNDGVTDGIEIMRGYNPNDSAAETIIRFESPKESVGLVRDDVLVVEEVLSVVQVESETTAARVKAEIRGKGLPNSFVTLYIFSTPTVVTVKTDADGHFVYTFDKELEDGEHDVYIAMTDNAGEIIAQSNPFSFIKEAQAFTKVDAAESDEVIVNQTVIDSPNNTYSVVVGMGILAFGLILLMLGISLRPKETEDEEVKKNKETLNQNGVSLPKKVENKFEHIDAS